MKNNIPKNLRFLIRVKGFNQSSFAKELGFTGAQVGSWLSGVVNMPITKLNKICKHFDISLDNFVNGDLENELSADFCLSKPDPTSFICKEVKKEVELQLKKMSKKFQEVFNEAA